MRRLICAFALILGLAGCGGSEGGTLDAGSARALGRELALVRAEAARGARGPALTALSVFASRVAADARAGRLTPAEHTALDTGIRRVRATLSQPAPGTTTSPAHATTATTRAPAATTTATVTQTAPTGPPGHAKHGKKDHKKDEGD